MNIKHARYFAFILMVSMPAISLADAVSVRGLRVGAPGDSLSDSEGSIDGSLGYMQFSLNYKKKINFYFAGSIAFDAVQNGEEKKSAREVDELPNDVQFNADSASYGSISVSVGGTFNLNNFDNIVLFLGPVLSFGDTYIESNEGDAFLVEDIRFGAMGGVVFAFEKVFLALDYVSVTNSPGITIGYGF